MLIENKTKKPKIELFLSFRNFFNPPHTEISKPLVDLKVDLFAKRGIFERERAKIGKTFKKKEREKSLFNSKIDFIG